MKLDRILAKMCIVKSYYAFVGGFLDFFGEKHFDPA